MPQDVYKRQELLTRNNFEGWMPKLMERLDRQDELLQMCIRDRKRKHWKELLPHVARQLKLKWTLPI